MDYNLGDGGFASFRGFIGYVCAGQWAQAAADGKGTAWCGQVGNRCTGDMAAVASGCGGPSPSPPSPSPPSPSPPSPSPPSGGCRACVEYGGGAGCLSRCGACGYACTSCIKGGGGKACSSRCAGQWAGLWCWLSVEVWRMRICLHVVHQGRWRQGLLQPLRWTMGGFVVLVVCRGVAHADMPARRASRAVAARPAPAVALDNGRVCGVTEVSGAAGTAHS